MALQADFPRDLHEIWAALHAKLWPRVKLNACRDYLDGAAILELPSDCIPSLDFLNGRITPLTGWTIERTHVRYTDAVPWYKKFAQRVFLITDYMRSREEIEWTPEPDMWHDIFGHLPFMTLKHYAELEEMFAPAFLAARNDEQRENIKRLAWFSTEFGLIREKGEIKLFGAGLISGAAELDNVMQGKVPTLPFTIENVINYDKAVWEHNKILFIIESADQLKQELARYFDPIKAGKEPELTAS
jgi:phenylalanine-4-hydroxylase